MSWLQYKLNIIYNQWEGWWVILLNNNEVNVKQKMETFLYIRITH